MVGCIETLHMRVRAFALLIVLPLSTLPDVEECRRNFRSVGCGVVVVVTADKSCDHRSMTYTSITPLADA